MDARHQRIARNEAAFRTLNESLHREVHDPLGGESARSGFVCECAHADCASIVTVSLPKYEDVRADPMLFLAVPGHEIPDSEDVVERGEGFVVVRKHEEARPVAESTDPRA